jgi:hypothetical protein
MTQQFGPISFDPTMKLSQFPGLVQELGLGSPSNPYPTFDALLTAYATSLPSAHARRWAGSPAVEYEWIGTSSAGSMEDWLPISQQVAWARSGRKVACLGNSIMAANMPLQNATVLWSASAVYSLGNIIGRRYLIFSPDEIVKTFVVSVAGTSGAVEPRWESYAIGDSVADGSVTYVCTSGVSYAAYAPGYWTMAQQLAGSPLDEIIMVGRSGKTCRDILSYYDKVDVLNPDVIYFGPMWENDCGTSADLAGIESVWDLYIDAVTDSLAKGRMVMIQTLLPSGYIDATSLFTGYSAATATQAHTWLNSKIRNLSRTSDKIILFDCSDIYKDPNPANPVWPENATTYSAFSGSEQALKLTDGIHPNQVCAMKIAEPLSLILAANWPSMEMQSEPLNKYRVSKNPAQYGTSGTNGSGVTGSVSNSTTVNLNGADASAVASKVSRSGTLRSWLQIALTSSAAPSSTFVIVANVPMASTKLAVGDAVQAFAEIEVDSGENGNRGAHLWVRFTGAASNVRDIFSTAAPSSTSQDLGQGLTRTAKMIVKTPPYAIPSGTTDITFYFENFAREASTSTARFGSYWLAKTVTPTLTA